MTIKDIQHGGIDDGSGPYEELPDEVLAIDEPIEHESRIWVTLWDKAELLESVS